MTDMALPDSLQAGLDREISLFHDEYSKNFLKGETKDQEIGSPFFLYQPGSHTAVLLIHGFMAAPHEVREWADDLHSKGYTVYAPRLAGHGTSAIDLSGRSFSDWVDSVERGYAILSFYSKRIIVAGFSTGAGLALHQAVHHPERYIAVVSVSAPMKFSSISSRFSELIELWNDCCRLLKLDSFQKFFATNHPDNPEINYHRCPIHGFNQVKALMRDVDKGLPGVSIPALIVQGSGDPKVSPMAGKMIYDRIGSKIKTYVEIDHHRHGIVRGDVGKRVFSAVHDFLSQIVGNT
jgi:carboxylesterase